MTLWSNRIALTQGFLTFFVSFTPCQRKKKEICPHLLAVHKCLRVLRWFQKKGLQSEEPPNFTIIKVSQKKKVFRPKPRFSAGFPQIFSDFRSCPLFGQRKCGGTAIQCNTITFLILIIEVCFSLWFCKFTSSVGKIYPQGVNLPPVKNPCSNSRNPHWFCLQWSFEAWSTLRVKLWA